MFDNMVGGKQKKSRVVRNPMGFEVDFLHKVADLGAARLIVGNDKRAHYTKWRLRALLSQYPWKDGICIAVRENFVIGWLIGKWQCRRLNTQLEEFVCREENTIHCTVWSSRDPFDDSRGIKSMLAKVGGSEVGELDRMKQSQLDFILTKYKSGKINVVKAREFIKDIGLSPDDILPIESINSDALDNTQDSTTTEQTLSQNKPLPDNIVRDPITGNLKYKDEL